MYLLSDYKYDLPETRIAQVPAEKRDESRLLRMDRNTGAVFHHCFRDIETLLHPGDLLVINNTKVIPARLKGRKETGGKVEVLIIDYYHGVKQYEETGVFQCECLIRASKSPKKGAMLVLGEENALMARVEAIKDGIFDLRFITGGNFPDILRKTGQVPLPPYIKRCSLDKIKNTIPESTLKPVNKRDLKHNNNDKENYQTVYAAKEGAVAAPTAGLHFTKPLMARLKQKGIEFAELTLHVGYGTFVPVRVNDIRDHNIHSEFFSLSQRTADTINRAKHENRRIVAVGTTSVRTLEYTADDNGKLAAKSGMCDLFIYPGYKFKIVDAMITNFHLPESTLLMLVSAFAGRKNILAAYQEAVNEKYRFFSYGDAMLIDSGKTC